LKNIIREKIIISHHGRVRVRSRLFTDEELKDIITDKFPIKVEKNEDNEFELKYNNLVKGKENIVVIVRVNDPVEKSIRIITTYTE
jgi:hypothetical protein